MQHNDGLLSFSEWMARQQVEGWRHGFKQHLGLKVVQVNY